MAAVFMKHKQTDIKNVNVFEITDEIGNKILGFIKLKNKIF